MSEANVNFMAAVPAQQQAGNSRQQKQADAYLNFTVHVKTKDGELHRITHNCIFPLYADKKAHRALINNPDKVIDDTLIVMEATSIGFRESDDGTDLEL